MHFMEDWPAITLIVTDIGFLPWLGLGLAFLLRFDFNRLFSFWEQEKRWRTHWAVLPESAGATVGVSALSVRFICKSLSEFVLVAVDS